jgi:hypothetical protein
MTAFSKISRGQRRTQGNRKDGQGHPKGWGAGNGSLTLFAGAQMTSYTWQGTFPVFHIKPGRVNGLSGIVAKHEQSGTIEWFPFNTKPADIKARLDDLILEIMRHDAELAEAQLDADLIDIDEFMMTGEWVTS